MKLSSGLATMFHYVCFPWHWVIDNTRNKFRAYTKIFILSHDNIQIVDYNSDFISSSIQSWIFKLALSSSLTSIEHRMLMNIIWFIIFYIVPKIPCIAGHEYSHNSYYIAITNHHSIPIYEYSFVSITMNALQSGII